MFDVNNFIKSVVTQDAKKLKEYFLEDATINWHCSNESLTVDEYIRANCEYPGEWTGEVKRVELIGDSKIISVTKISDGTDAFNVVSFIELQDNKIKQLDEYFSACEEVPKWRLDMSVGRSII